MLLFTAYVTRVVWLEWLADGLVRVDAVAPADMIVVLGGDLRGRRILKAAELARDGYAPLVLVSGAGYLYGRHESDLAVQFAVDHGYDQALFLKFRFPAQSTREEAEAVVPELRRRHVRKYLLVTSNFHTARAGRIFRSVAPDLDLRVIAAYDDYFPVNGWWRSREARKIFAGEWLKTVTAWIGA